MTPDYIKELALKIEPNSESGTWPEKRREILTRILQDDISEFLTWSCVIVTMFVGDAPYIKTEHRAIVSGRSPDRWRYAFQEDWIGKPPALPWLSQSSGNLVHLTHHVFQWEMVTGKKISDLSSIVEIGGGYGAMARIVRRLGFSGDYTIIDFPEVQLLQRYYLDKNSVSGIRFLDAIPEDMDADLMIATWSLSEMEIEQRNKVLSNIKTDRLLVAYADCVWDGVDNKKYFADVPGEHIKIEHMMPWANSYLIR